MTISESMSSPTVCCAILILTHISMHLAHVFMSQVKVQEGTEKMRDRAPLTFFTVETGSDAPTGEPVYVYYPVMAVIRAGES